MLMHCAPSLMLRRIVAHLPTLLLAFWVGPAFASVGSQSQVSSAESQTPAKPQAEAVSSKNTDVASATCASCHEDLAKAFAKNPHQILEISSAKGWKDQSCESCHGPGEAHVNAGDGTQVFAFKGMSVKEVNRKCLTCHARAESHA